MSVLSLLPMEKRRSIHVRDLTKDTKGVGVGVEAEESPPSPGCGRCWKAPGALTLTSEQVSSYTPLLPSPSPRCSQLPIKTPPSRNFSQPLPDLVYMILLPAG